MRITGMIILAALFAAVAAPTDALQAGPYSEAKRVWAARHYDMDLRIDYRNERLGGSCAITLVNTTDGPLAEVPVILYRLMAVESITGPDGAPLAFEQNVVGFDGGYRHQVNFALAKLASPVGAGEETTVTIRYAGYLCGMTEVYGYVHDSIDPDFTIIRFDSDAYPTVCHPSGSAKKGAHLLRYTYDVRMTVPDTLVVANAGILEEKRRSGGMVTYRYLSKVPSWRMDFAVAQYRREQSGENIVFCLPEDSGRAGALLSAMDRTIELFTGWWGPLQDYAGITVIEVPENYGSQTDLAAIIQEAGAFRDDRNLYEFYHELSHKWNVKTTDENPCRIEEGLAVFLQSVTIEELEDREHLHDYMGRIISHLSGRYEDDPDLAEVPISMFGEKDLTGLSYTAGALFYYILHDITGREAFNRMIETFYEEYYGSGADLETMLEHYSRHSDTDLSRLFEDWLYSAKYASYIRGGMTIDEMAALYR